MVATQLMKMKMLAVSLTPYATPQTKALKPAHERRGRRCWGTTGADLLFSAAVYDSFGDSAPAAYGRSSSVKSSSKPMQKEA